MDSAFPNDQIPPPKEAALEVPQTEEGQQSGQDPVEARDPDQQSIKSVLSPKSAPGEQILFLEDTSAPEVIYESSQAAQAVSVEEIPEEESQRADDTPAHSSLEI